MTRDPREGVRADGTITTGVGAVPVGAPYDDILQAAAEQVTAAAGDALHGLYVYGSVATGQAHPPSSDVDLYAIVLRDDVVEICRDVAAELTDRFASVARGVSISVVLLGDLLADTSEGRTERCFVRHYCLPVAGRDLRPSLHRCQASVELALGFNGNVGEVIDRLVYRLSSQTVDAQATRHATAVGARKLLMSAATLLSAREQGWSTDRDEGARLLSAGAPSLAGMVARVQQWTNLDATERPPPPRAEVVTAFQTLSRWLAREYSRFGRRSGQDPQDSS